MKGSRETFGFPETSDARYAQFAGCAELEELNISSNESRRPNLSLNSKQ